MRKLLQKVKSLLSQYFLKLPAAEVSKHVCKWESNNWLLCAICLFCNIIWIFCLCIIFWTNVIFNINLLNTRGFVRLPWKQNSMSFITHYKPIWGNFINVRKGSYALLATLQLIGILSTRVLCPVGHTSIDRNTFNNLVFKVSLNFSTSRFLTVYITL